MVLSLSIPLGALLLLSPSGAAPDPFPLEFDLVFPRNETYAPTQFLPLVLAIRNAPAAWPLGLLASVSIRPHSSPDTITVPFNSTFFFPPRGPSQGPPPLSSPGGIFFGIAGTNVTNTTAPQSYSVIWYVSLENTCVENAELGYPALRRFTTREFVSQFSTAPGGKVPDVEAAAAQCARSAVGLQPVRMLGGRPGEEGGCPVMERNASVVAATDACGMGAFGKGLAADVGRAMLGLMGCEEGVWQEVRQPCLPEKKRNGGPRGAEGGRWIQLLGVVVGVAVAVAL